ncbi:MAG: SUMF1/EgtB/PvdO family nonheme iron enzyme [Rubrivivax sp.]|nr:SUMF1/EgtB/PvdO family nonheme iron enzyme [Rubrivivax sp.]
MGTGHRRLRGGSWNNTADNARSAYRNDNTPDNWNDNIGFRCVVAPHSISRPECRAFTGDRRAPKGRARGLFLAGVIPAKEVDGPAPWGGLFCPIGAGLHQSA